MIAAKTIVRVSVCQFSMLSPQTHGLPVEMIQITNAAMAAEQNDREREFVPSRRWRRLALGADAGLLPLRRAHQKANQKRQHADDDDDDHRLDEDGASLFQRRPDLPLMSLHDRRYRPFRISVSAHLRRLSLAACCKSSPRERPWTLGATAVSRTVEPLARNWPTTSILSP